MLGKVDLKIIAALQRNGRASVSEIAKIARISVPRAHYRLQKLVEEKTILGFYSLIDFSRLGFSVYRLMFQFSAPETAGRQDFLDFISNHPCALWSAECGGRWDFLADFLARDIFSLDFILKKIFKKYEKLGFSFDFLVIRQFYYPKSTGLPAKILDNGLLSGTLTPMTEKDSVILLQLVAEPRLPITEISKRTGIHPLTIRKRILSLKKEGVLLGVIPQLNMEKFGLETFKILLSFSDEKTKQEIISYAALLPETAGLIETFGPWALEIEINVINSKAAKEFLYSLRKKFSNTIKDFEILPITKEYSYKFLPADFSLH